MITQALSIQGRLSPRGFDKALRRWLPLCYLCVIAVSLTEPRIMTIPSDTFTGTITCASPSCSWRR